jgi:hypothetical protein
MTSASFGTFRFRPRGAFTLIEMLVIKASQRLDEPASGRIPDPDRAVFARG